jgi:hypothetical protein
VKGFALAGVVQSVADLTRSPALAVPVVAKKIAVAQVAAAAIRRFFRVSDFKVVPP